MNKTLTRVKVEKKGSLSPIEQFRGLQAYRSLLRQARAEVNLDDLHSSNGNSIYRFQVKVGVFPGKDKDKMGILRFTFSPPKLDEEKFQKIYLLWLDHMAFRLNQPLHEARRGCPRPARGYSSFMSSKSSVALFTLKVIPVLMKNGKECKIILPIPPIIPDKYKDMVETHNRMAFSKLRIDLGSPIIIPPKSTNKEALNKILNKFFKEEKKEEDETEKNRKTDFVKDLYKSEEFENHYVQKNLMRLFTSVSTENSNQSLVPKEFKKHLVNQKWIAKGNAYSYSIMPARQDQVSSTSAKSVSSMETAFSLAATALTKGAKGGGDFASFDRVAAAVEALETNPIVVGFASRDSSSAKQAKFCEQSYSKMPRVCKLDESGQQQLPQIGWVFGPRARLNPATREIQLIHSPEHHNVAADLSIPGWCPGVRITVQKAWIGNWKNSGAMIREVEKTDHGGVIDEFWRPLPQRTADWDSLTNHLSKKIYGNSQELLDIREVEPYYLTACEDKVTLKILGSNIWRGTRVFLAGTEGENLHVLPDMEGVKVTFNIAQMLNTKNTLNDIGGFEQHIPLTVWSQNGSDTLAIPFNGVRSIDEKGKAICKSTFSLAATTREDHLAIVRTSPIRIPACGDVNIVVQLFHIDPKIGELKKGNPELEKIKFFIDGIKGDLINENLIYENKGDENEKFTSTGIFQVKFDAKKILANQPNRTGTLTVTDDKNVASSPLSLVSCKKKDTTTAGKNPAS